MMIFFLNKYPHSITHFNHITYDHHDLQALCIVISQEFYFYTILTYFFLPTDRESLMCHNNKFTIDPIFGVNILCLNINVTKVLIYLDHIYSSV